MHCFLSSLAVLGLIFVHTSDASFFWEAYPSRTTTPIFSNSSVPDDLLLEGITKAVLESQGGDDFAAFNAFIKYATLRIPPQRIVKDGVDVDLTAIQCANMRLTDIAVHSEEKSQERVALSVDIIGVKMECKLHWAVKYGIIHSSGIATAQLGKSNMYLAADVFSQNFTLSPPERIVVSKCQMQLRVETLDFSGGLVASLLSVVSPLVKAVLITAIGPEVCNGLDALAGPKANELLERLQTLLSPYLAPHTATPLADEKAFAVAHPSQRLVNLQASRLLASLEGLAASVLGEGGAAVNSFMKRTNGEVAVDLGSDGLQLFAGETAVARANITATRLVLRGLSSFERLQVLRVVGRQTVSTAVGLGELQLEVELLVEMAGGEVVQGPAVVAQHVNVSVPLRGAQVELALFLPIDLGAFSRLLLGAAIDRPGCALGVLAGQQQGQGAGGARVAALAGRLDSVGRPAMRGFVSPGLDRLFSQASGAALALLQGSMLKAMPSLLDGPVKAALNKELQAWLNEGTAGTQRACLLPPLPLMHALIDLRELPWLGEAALALSQGLGPSGLNQAVAALTGGVDGSLALASLEGLHMRGSLGGGFGHYSFKLIKALLQGLRGVVAEVDLLETIGPHDLSNRLLLARGEAVAMVLEPLIRMAHTPLLFDHVRAVLGASNASLALNLTVKVAEGRLRRLRLAEAVHLPCWLAVLEDGSGVQALQLEMGGLLAEMTCGFNVTSSELSFDLHGGNRVAMPAARLAALLQGSSCSSPGFAAFTHNAQDPRALAAALDSINSAAAAVTHAAVAAANRLVSESPQACKAGLRAMEAAAAPRAGQVAGGGKGKTKAGASPTAADTAAFLRNIVVVLAVAVVVCISGCGLHCGRQWRRWRGAKRHNHKARVEVAGGAGVAEAAEGLEGTSLAWHPAVPLVLRLSIPLLVAANIAFFLSGHLSMGARVDADLTLAGDAVPVRGLYDFSLGESLGSMLSAGAYLLVIFIGAFSGLWPYAKLLTLLYCWLTPPLLLKPSTRGTVLHLLDAMGKWSLIDMYVLVQSMLAFRLSIALPPPSPETPPMLPTDFLALRTRVTPLWGIFSFLIAVTMALCLSHAAAALHRNAMSFDNNNTAEDKEDVKDDKGRVVAAATHAANAAGHAAGLQRPVSPVSAEAVEVEMSVSSRPLSSLASVSSAPFTPLSPSAGGGESKFLRLPSPSSATLSSFQASSPSPTSLMVGSAPPLGSALEFHPPQRPAKLSLGGAGSSGGMQRSSRSESFAPHLSPASRTMSASSSSWFEAGTADVHGKRRALVQNKAALFSHAFALRSPLGKGDRARGQVECYLVLRPLAAYGLTALLVLALLLLVLGSFAPSFDFTVQGLAAVAVSWTGSPVKVFSSFTAFGQLAAQAEDDPDNLPGLYFLTALCLSFAFLVPLAQLCLLTVMWVWPLTLQAQKKFLFTSEVLAAWSALDVYLLSVVIGLVSVGQVAGFMVGDSCDSLQPVMDDVLVPLRLLSEEEATCFAISARILWGIPVLFASSLLASLCCALVQRLSEAAVEDREARVKGRVPSNEEVPESMRMTGCSQRVLHLLLRCASGVFVQRLDRGLARDSAPWLQRRSAAKNRQWVLGGRGRALSDPLLRMYQGSPSYASSMASMSKQSLPSASHRIGSRPTVSPVAKGSAFDFYKPPSEMSPAETEQIVDTLVGDLPTGWLAVQTEDGQDMYFWNEITGAVSNAFPFMSQNIDSSVVVP